MLRANARGPGRLGNRGQALVEAAVVLPLLLLLIVGMIEMSLAWRGYQVVTNAAREGARVALLPTADFDQVRDRVFQSTRAGGLLDADVRFYTECDGVPDRVCAEGATGTEALVRVELDYTFRLLQPLARLACWGGCDDANFGLVTIASTSTMRNE
jgi:hypothetical protein